MDRRHFLASAAGVATVATGCVGFRPPGTQEHPFAGASLTVRIDSDTESPHDLRQLARDALAFWEEHSRQYVGFGVSFDVLEPADTPATDPDLVLAYANHPRVCENVPSYSERVMGCAPLIRPGNRISRPITAYVVAAARPPGMIRITTKHEIGHVLGLGHDDEPRSIMSNLPADRIPQYDLRVDLWDTVREIHRDSLAATQVVNYGIDRFVDGEYVAAAAAFATARDAFEWLQADVERARERIAAFDETSVETIALATLEMQFSRLSERTSIAVEITAALSRAAEASAAADDATRAAERQTASERIAAFNDVDDVELRDVAIALGLVQGYDRGQPVVPLDERAPLE